MDIPHVPAPADQIRMSASKMRVDAWHLKQEAEHAAALAAVKRAEADGLDASADRLEEMAALAEAQDKAEGLYRYDVMVDRERYEPPSIRALKDEMGKRALEQAACQAAHTTRAPEIATGQAAWNDEHPPRSPNAATNGDDR